MVDLLSLVVKRFKGIIFIDGKIKIEDFYYVNKLRYNFHNIIQIEEKVARLIFIECEIRKGDFGRLVVEGIKTYGYAHCLK